MPDLDRATQTSGVSACKTVDDVRRQKFRHAVQEERQQHELVDRAEHGHGEIQRLDSEQCQDGQCRHQPSGTILMPEGKPKQAQVLTGNSTPQCKDTFHAVLHGLGR